MNKHYIRNEDQNGWIDTSNTDVSITYYDNQDILYKYANGHQSYYYSTGDIKEIYPNGTITEINAATNEHKTIYPDDAKRNVTMQSSHQNKVIQYLRQLNSTQHIDDIHNPKKKFRAARRAIAKKFGHKGP